jgi:hypothetical protein
MEDYDDLWLFLREFFNYEHYTHAIQKIRQAVANDPTYKMRWLRIADLIRKRSLLPGQPLTLLHEGANQVLYENSDEEAYNWLDKMVRNVEREDGEIESYS